MTPEAQAIFLTKLIHENDYYAMRPVRNGTYWVGLHKYMFTTAILLGKMGDTTGFEDRWCYHSAAEAERALAMWDGETGEPEGWHRNPRTGRRRQDGNEWINF